MAAPYPKAACVGTFHSANLKEVCSRTHESKYNASVSSLLCRRHFEQLRLSRFEASKLEDLMQSHKVTGGGGAQIHVVETGNRQGRSILYIHGMSQCWLAWSRQLNSDLAQDYRLVAMDMRGHGLSDKPEQGYADTELWADDVNAVIETLRLHNPVLCGWSYGPLAILDYVRHYGEDNVGGLHFVGGVTKLGSKDAVAVLTPEFLGLLAGFFSTDVRESASSLEALLRSCFAREPAIEDLYLMLGYNISVPPYVRQALLSDTDDFFLQEALMNTANRRNNNVLIFMKRV